MADINRPVRVTALLAPSPLFLTRDTHARVPLPSYAGKDVKDGVRSFRSHFSQIRRIRSSCTKRRRRAGAEPTRESQFRLAYADSAAEAKDRFASRRNFKERNRKDAPGDGCKRRLYASNGGPSLYRAPAARYREKPGAALSLWYPTYIHPPRPALGLQWVADHRPSWALRRMYTVHNHDTWRCISRELFGNVRPLASPVSPRPRFASRLPNGETKRSIVPAREIARSQHIIGRKRVVYYLRNPRCRYLAAGWSSSSSSPLFLLFIPQRSLGVTPFRAHRTLLVPRSLQFLHVTNAGEAAPEKRHRTKRKNLRERVSEKKRSVAIDVPVSQHPTKYTRAPGSLAGRSCTRSDD